MNIEKSFIQIGLMIFHSYSIDFVYSNHHAKYHCIE